MTEFDVRIPLGSWLNRREIDQVFDENTKGIVKARQQRKDISSPFTRGWSIMQQILQLFLAGQL